MDHRKVLDKAPVPILVHRDGVPLYVNEAALQLTREMGFALTAEHIERFDVFALEAPEEQETWHRNYARIMQTRTPQFNVRRTLVDAQGTRQVVLGSARPIDWDGEPAMEVTAVLLGPAAELKEALAPPEANAPDTLARMVRPAVRARAAALDRLTPREMDVAMLVAEGYSTEAIALRLDIAVATVRTHLKKTYKKTGCHSRVQLTRFLLGRANR